MLKCVLISISLLFILLDAHGQIQDTLPYPVADTTRIKESLPQEAKPSPTLTQPRSRGDNVDRLTAMKEQTDGAFANPVSAPIPGDGEAVVYGSKDSSRTDLVSNKIHLYGEAFVKYEGSEITADYIVFDLSEKQVKATTRPNQKIRPRFVSGSNDVSADSLRYNIDSEQGIVYGARIQQQNYFIHGAITKFIKAGQDSLHIDDVIYNKNALITSCDHEEPHWGIRTTKLKMIPEKLVVVGPMDVELAGIPTPLAFPFAFAPLFSFGQASSGLIAPDQWLTTDARLGIGMRNIGYHFAISDKMNLTVNGDIYTRGSWAVRTKTDYRKRYKYQGSIGLSFSRQILDVRGSLTPSINSSYEINISHRQDNKAHPYRTVGGTLRFTVNNYAQRNLTDASSQLNNQINSNFNYQYKINSKLNFSAGMSHSQNTSNNSISFTLPQVQLRLSTIYPFKKAGTTSSNEAWYEKINMQYNGKFINNVSTIDTILFTKETLESFRAGFTHELDMAASYKVFKYFSFNTNINYDEFWYLQTFEGTKADENGRIVEGDIRQGFTPLRDLNVSAGLNTNVFGTILFKKGWLRGLRHRMTPSLNLSYRPDTESYYEYFDQDPDSFLDQPIRYNPFSSALGERLFRSSALQRGGMSMNYSIENRIEGKYWSKKDSTEKKFKVFDRIRLSGNYNFQADSLKWSPVRLSANAKFLNNKTTLQISGTLDPYVRLVNAQNTRGVRVNRTVWSQGGGLLRLDDLSLTLNTTFTLKDIRNLFGGEKDTDAPSAQQRSSGSRSKGRAAKNNKVQASIEYPELFSWFENFRIQHVLRLSIRDNGNGKEFMTSANSIQITTGQIPLSENWSMQIGNISYDLRKGEWVYPSFNLTRQLHCWEMRFGWQPQLFSTYTFYIGVKASPFSDFLKYNNGRDTFTDYRRRF